MSMLHSIRRNLVDIHFIGIVSRQLKALEDEGLIIRTEYQQIPPKVEYRLSEIGEKFRTVLSALEVWGNEYIAYWNRANGAP